MRKVKWIIFISVAMLFLVSPCVSAQEVASPKDVLRGIEAICIEVAQTTPDEEKYGLTKEKLQRDVELKLRFAGIKLLSEKEFNTYDDVKLFVWVSSRHDAPTSQFVYSISVELFEYLKPIRNLDKIIYTSTWRDSSFGVVPQSEFEQSLRHNINDLLDKFLNDYLSVNPKK